MAVCLFRLFLYSKTTEEKHFATSAPEHTAGREEEMVSLVALLVSKWEAVRVQTGWNAAHFILLKATLWAIFHWAFKHTTAEVSGRDD